MRQDVVSRAPGRAHGETAGSRRRRASPGDAGELIRRTESEVKLQLARELHDRVAHILTLMVVDMEQFKLDVAATDEVISSVDRFQDATRKVLHNLRQVLYDLREEPSTDHEFVAQVRQRVDRFAQSTGIHARLRPSAAWPPWLPAATAHNLHRIVEEALTNVRMHSGASEVDVELDATAHHLVVVIRDDGGSLPQEPRRGLGLVGMRERAALLGGALEVTSEPGRATTVRAVVPTPGGGRAG